MRSRSGTNLGVRWLLSLTALVVCLAFGVPAHASPQYPADCTDCHNMPPIDAPDGDKNPDTGAVPGNHQKHATSDVNSCAKCHGDVVTTYATGHRNKTIEFRSELGYDPKRAFFNQTSVPPVPLGGCSTAACHSNGKGVYRLTPSWNTTAAATCDTCHDSTPTTNSHTKHVATYAYGCANCHTNHATDAKPFSHATSAGRAIDVHFSGTNTGGSFAGNQCSNLYCHSNGKGGAPNATPTWGGSVDCASCHGNATSTGGSALSGKHANHVNNDAFLGTSYGCKECHAGTVAGANGTITDTTKHVNGGVDFAGANVGTPSAGSCSTSYCHSDGKGAFRTVTWTQSQTLSCNGCHGTGNAFGAPDYASGLAGSATANSHGKHALASGDCVNCHSTTTTTGTSIIAGSAHIDGAATLAAGNGKSFTPGANKTCSNISCHSGNGIVQNVATAQWGASLNCQGCHSTISASHSAHTGIYGCVTCHSDTVVDSTTIKAGGAHMNNAINVIGAKITTFTLADQSCATSCHISATPKWDQPATGACGTCHNVTSPLIATNAHSKHFTAVNGPNFTQDVTGCQVCHLYTGERTATHSDGVKNLNAGFNVSGGCSTCHAQATTNWISAASVTCESCHSTAGGALSVINTKTAPDKTLAATKGHGAKGQACAVCHDPSSAHIGAPVGTQRLQAALTGAGNTACDYCHLDAGKVTSASLNMKAHQATGIGSLCSDCHDPHGTTNDRMINGTINGFGVSYTGTTTFVNGAQNGVCQVCHTTTKFFTQPGITPPQSHVDSTTNCLQCHSHNPSTGLAFHANGACDTCHGYPPAPRSLLGSYGFSGNWSTARFEDYSGGGGAHTLLAHLSKDIKPSDGWAPCLTCHSGGDATHQRVLPIKDHVENVTVKVDQQWRFSNKRQLAYSSAVLASGGANKTGSCFNVACHVKKSKKWSTER